MPSTLRRSRVCPPAVDAPVPSATRQSRTTIARPARARRSRDETFPGHSLAASVGLTPVGINLMAHGVITRMAAQRPGRVTAAADRASSHAYAAKAWLRRHDGRWPRTGSSTVPPGHIVCVSFVDVWRQPPALLKPLSAHRSRNPGRGRGDVARDRPSPETRRARPPDPRRRRASHRSPRRLGPPIAARTLEPS